MSRTRGDGCKIRVGRGDVALAVIVVPPGGDRPVGLKAQAMHNARGDRHEIGIRLRYGALAIVTRPPGRDYSPRVHARYI